MNGQSIQKVFEQLFGGKKVIILGFGREGQSTYRAFCRYLPGQGIAVADANPISEDFFLQQACQPSDIYTGTDYLRHLNAYDCVVKSPGVSFSVINGSVDSEKVYSQAGIFISAFRSQIIGITGTKGKSTTSTLLYRILHAANADTVFVGNIGVPPLDMADKVGAQTRIVYELSSHQLEYLKVSPHISIYLNMFEEHLDHYSSYYEYQQAKFNIAKWQKTGDYLIYNADNDIVSQWVCSHELLSQKIPLSMKENLNTGFLMHQEKLLLRLKDVEKDFSALNKNRKLPGLHNLWNVMAAVAAAILNGVPDQKIAEVVSEFEGLPHRLQLLGEVEQVKYYNDSISTIPEAAIEALKTLPQTHTLILGGFDRGINYQLLIDYLIQFPVPLLIFMGDAGLRMKNLLEEHSAGNKELKYCYAQNLQEAVRFSREMTPKGSVCLMSPAAASYNEFKNFEERGMRFKELLGL